MITRSQGRNSAKKLSCKEAYFSKMSSEKSSKISAIITTVMTRIMERINVFQKKGRLFQYVFTMVIIYVFWVIKI
jgi:dipeptide/tripeptide permease